MYCIIFFPLQQSRSQVSQSGEGVRRTIFFLIFTFYPGFPGAPVSGWQSVSVFGRGLGPGLVTLGCIYFSSPFLFLLLFSFLLSHFPPSLPLHFPFSLLLSSFPSRLFQGVFCPCPHWLRHCLTDETTKTLCSVIYWRMWYRTVYTKQNERSSLQISL